MSVPEILNEINDYADALETAALWHNSKESIDRVSHKQKINNGEDYIYEFYCYVRVLVDLMYHYKVVFKAGTGKNAMNFPQAPCPKKGRPYFMVKDKETGIDLFQVCAGTQIKTIFPPMQAAPDISFQKPNASDTPDHTEVFAIFDAKFNRGKTKIKVSQGQLSEVTSMIANLQLNTPVVNNIRFKRLAGLTKNCLLTNGKAHFNNLAYHQHHNLLEIENFTVKAVLTIVG